MAGLNTLLLIAAILMTSAPLLRAQGLEPVRYALTFPAPNTHYVEVEASIPADAPTVELMMPVWTPGSYLVREYARHVEAVAARDEAGGPLAVEKSAKNRWRIETRGRPRITVTYRVYGREMSVRTNWIDAEFALINGAPTFLTVAGELTRPHEVTVTLPPAWKQAHTALPALPGPAHRFRAPDYDTLVDSPMVLGNPAVYEFAVDGKLHVLVNVGEAGVFDGARVARDLEQVVLEHRRMWGALPYERYLFFNMITEAGGGLEHASSSVLMTSRWATRT
ncbi:MAG: hypothetical protein Q7J25_11585, partial [Vicinamibacterales bacterium]|nr:hypothetical protein [Vicinamibacterales bacterium]